jgi:hypothetical protein
LSVKIRQEVQMQIEFKIPLGARVRDRVTGVEGTVVCVAKWLYGCLRYTVQPRQLKDGSPVTTTTFDEDALELLTGADEPDVKTGGGPVPEPGRQPDPGRP